MSRHQPRVARLAWRRPQWSVRVRLTAAVAALMLVVSLALASFAPTVVRGVLVDDVLAADAEASAATLADTSGMLAMMGSIDGFGGLQGLVADAVGRTVTNLGPAQQQLRSRSADGLVLVALSSSAVVRVDTGGRATLVSTEVSALGTPVVAVSELFALSAELQGGAGVFTELLSGTDPMGFDGLSVPQGMAEVMAERFGAGRPGGRGQFGAPAVTSSVDPEDLAWAVRRVDGIAFVVGAPVDGVTRSVGRVGTGLGWSVPVTMLLAAWVTWLLAGRALRPVRAITERAAQIGAGTLHERVPVPATGDEIALLATTMNDMLGRLQAEDARRRRFVSDASHELRSPVAVLRTAADVALQPASHTAVAELAGTVQVEADRMAAMISDLLALARHDEGRAGPSVAVDLDDIVLREAARPRGLALDVRAVSAGRTLGRPDELARLVAHLLDNAARHARGVVEVALRTEGDRVLLSVDDDGPGVPSDRRQAIFERFVRLDEARSRDRGGAGLGLAVVSSTAENAGGWVEVTDSPLGGARFVVSLPAAV